jgi:hypothetical protein
MEKRDKLIKDGQFTSAFDSLVSESIDRWKVPGLSIAVIHNNAICAKVYRIVSLRLYMLSLNRAMDLPDIPTCQSRLRRSSTARACLKRSRQQPYLCWLMIMSNIQM